MKKFTKFIDMSSGGSEKEDFSSLAVALPKKEAIAWFTKKFQNPYNVTCDCCGPDFSVIEVNIEEGNVSQLENINVVVFNPKFSRTEEHEDLLASKKIINFSPEKTFFMSNKLDSDFKL